MRRAREASAEPSAEHLAGTPAQTPAQTPGEPSTGTASEGQGERQGGGPADSSAGGSTAAPAGPSGPLPLPQGTKILGTLDTEFQREQLEFDTKPCVALSELGGEIQRWRRTMSALARDSGAEVAALATSPTPVEPSLTPSSRYWKMAREYALTAQEQLTCGCHVHVQVDSAEEGVGVLDHVRPWLGPLLALSANSPFWKGTDTGFSSYRYQVWGRWPSAGPTDLFGSVEEYRATVEAMLACGTLLDEAMIYFDARLSHHYPTVEIRIADVCLHAEDTVLIAALVRALVETAARAWADGLPPPRVRTELLHLACWRASRSGLDDELVHPLTHRPVPAETAVRALFDHVTPALSDAGDLDVARHLLDHLLRRGNGTRLQREAHRRGGDTKAVVTEAIARTLAL